MTDVQQGQTAARGLAAHGAGINEKDDKKILVRKVKRFKRLKEALATLESRKEYANDAQAQKKIAQVRAEHDALERELGFVYEALRQQFNPEETATPA